MKLATFAVVCKRTAERFVAKNTLEMGAALAYYAVFSLAPLVLIAISIAGAVFGEQAAQGQVGIELEKVVGPAVADATQTMVHNAAASSRTASIVGIGVLLFGASGVFGQLLNSLNTIWEVPAKNTGGIWGFVRSRLLSFAMVIGTGFLLIVSLVVSTTLSAMSAYLAPGETAYYQLLNQVITFATITILFAIVFKSLPDCHVAWADVWVGAAVTAILFILGRYLIGVYLAKLSVASAYGAAGSLVLILLWVYYASQIVLFGAQFTQVFATLRRDAAAGRV
jgi:membrane protein